MVKWICRIVIGLVLSPVVAALSVVMIGGYAVLGVLSVVMISDYAVLGVWELFKWAWKKADWPGDWEL